MPFVQVCGVNQRFRARPSSAIVRARSMPAASDDVRLVDVEGVRVEGGEDLGERPRHLAAGDPDAGRRGAQRRQPAQVRAVERLLHPQDAELGEPCGDLAGPRPGRGRRDVSPAIRQPWLRSTMIAIESPTAARVALTAASPSSRRRGSTRIFIARKPSSRSRSADSARAAGASSIAARRVGGDAVGAPRRTASRPAARRPCRARSQRAASSGQYRPAWKSIVSRTRTWRAIASGSWPMNRCSKASKPSIVSPEPMPVDALVGLDAHDRRRERPAAAPGPSRLERRVERHDEPLRSGCAVMRIARQYRAVRIGLLR